MRIVVSLITLSVAGGTGVIQLPADNHIAHWQRYPLLAVPLVETAPVVDGTVDTREWFAASRIGYLLDEKTGEAGIEPSAIAVGSTPTHLLVAFQFARPEHARLPTMEDVFEIHLDLDHGHNNAATLVGNFEKLLSASTELGAVEYKARITDQGWEGELSIPLQTKPGQIVGANFVRREKTPADRAWLWSYTGRFPPGIRNFGHLVCTGAPLAVWVDPAGWLQGNREAGLVFSAVNFSAEEVALKLSAHVRTSEKAKEMSLLPTLDDATTDDLGRPRGSVAEEVTKAMQAFATVTNVDIALRVPAHGRELARVSVADAPGEYLAGFAVQRSDAVIAGGVVPFRVPAPLGVKVQGHLLLSKALDYEIDLQRLKESITSNTTLRVVAKGPSEQEVAHEEFRGLMGKAKIHGVFRFEPNLGANYRVVATLLEGDKVIARNDAFLTAPPKETVPDWWMMNEGSSPLIPPPWTPVQAGKRSVQVLGRKYEFDKLALPSQLTTRGVPMLAGPIELRAAEPWQKSQLKLVENQPDFAVYESESVAGGTRLKVRSQVEFDGFTYVELDLTGSAPLDRLDLIISFKREHATLMQNYFKTGGPGDYQWKNPHDEANPYKRGRRFVGFVPEYTLQTPPMLTTWIGTDHYGLEWSCDSSRGWGMSDPNKAMEVSRDGDRVLLTVHLINKPVTLTEKPRKIRFGLCATPTKTLLPYLARARFYDDYTPYLLPMQWGEYPVWHPPVKNPGWIETNKTWIASTHGAGKKRLVNGGWNISAQPPEWNIWGRELALEPLQNVSFENNKQFAGCYKTPYAPLLANSFGYNARLLGFDGIRFDTVIPNYECSSLVHDCGWYDDDGNLWPSYSVFGAREAWKRLYRIFHGGVIEKGCIQTPNAAGPLMAVHSFSDHHEIGEGYYMHAKTLKDGMPPDMIRANMTGGQYGFRAEVSIKGGPLHWNEKIAACLVNGAEPRFEDHRGWKAGYEAQAKPAVSVWNAFDWVDRWNARWLGHWENQGYANLQLPIANYQLPMVMASFWWNAKLKRVLLVLGNYETEPFDDVEVKLDLAKLGLKGKVYAEDAITLEPVAISADGTMKLDVYGQRYRLIKISHEPPRFRDEALSDNLLANTPAVVDKTWQSDEVKLEPNSVYVVSGQLKIDKPMGEGSANPNVMTMFSPGIYHAVSLQLAGEGVHGIVATNTLGLCGVKGQEGWFPYTDTPTYKLNYYPKHWEKTPGWMTVFLPVATGTNATTGRVAIGITDPGQAQLRDVVLRRFVR